MIDLNDYSPLYGPIHANGLPVLGMPFLPAFARGEITADDWPAHVLEPGPMNVSCIEFKEGGVFVRGIETEGNILPGAWDYDDVAVVMALLYAEPSGPLSPNFDMRIEGDVIHKSWSPHWLAKTNLGKTMFCSFSWLQGLVLRPDELCIAPKDECIDPEYHDIAVNLVSGLKRFKVAFALTDQDKFILKPGTMSVDLQEMPADSQEGNRMDYRLNIHDFRLEAQVIRKEENRHIVDREATEGLNQMYSDIEYLLPVFRRSACIMALYVGLDHLRKQTNYLFRQDIREQIIRDYQNMISAE